MLEERNSALEEQLRNLEKQSQAQTAALNAAQTQLLESTASNSSAVANLNAQILSLRAAESELKKKLYNSEQAAASEREKSVGV
jgi:uncharacterized protein (DUF2141 family)